MCNSKQAQNAVILLVSGAVLGAAGALLYAPHSGRHMRKKISRQIKHSWALLAMRREKLTERASELLEVIEERTRELADAGADITADKKKELTNAIVKARRELERLRGKFARLRKDADDVVEAEAEQSDS